MNIVVWGINYAPEMTGIGPCNAALCRHLQARGHSVRMLTSFSYYPEWRKRDGDRRTLLRTESDGGVRVHRCWHYVPSRPTAIRRMLHEMSFVLWSFVVALFLPRPDLYVVVSPPLLLGPAAWILGLLRRRPYFFHVQDLQPDAAAAMGMLREGWLLRALRGIEDLSYRKAARVSSLSDGMVRAIGAKGVPSSRLGLFPNGTEIPDPESLPPRGRFRARCAAAAGRFLAVYSGNLGVKHGVEVLLGAAAALPADRFHVVVSGDGARREALQSMASRLEARNVTLLPLQPEAGYLEMMVDADAYVVTQQQGSGTLFFPSKLLKGLALGKPIVVVADEDSELSRAAREGGYALVVPPGRPDLVARAFERLASDGELRLRLGRAARVAAQSFETGRVHAAFEAWMLASLGSPVSPATSEVHAPAGPLEPATLQRIP